MSTLLTHSYFREYRASQMADTLWEDTESDTPPSSPIAAINTLFTSLPPVWARLKTNLTAANAAADSAQTLHAVEAAWSQLQSLRDGPLDNLTTRVDDLSTQLTLWRRAQPDPNAHGDLQTRLDTWAETLRTDASVTALRLRLTPAFPSSIIPPEDYQARLQHGGILSVVTAELAVHSLPRRWATLQFTSAETDWSSPRQRLEATPAPALADFDAAIARDLMTPALWAKREQAAQRENASWPQLAWSAYEARRSDDAALQTWFAPRLATNDEQLDTQLAALVKEQNFQGFDALMRNLERDPGNLTALETLYRFLAPTDELDAANILTDFWALGPIDYTVTNEDLGLALRTARWPLLLSLADYRLRANDADTDAHLHRQIAALALGLPGLVADSTAALEGTVYRHTTRLLHAMAFGFGKGADTIYRNPQLGLRSSYELIGNDHDDPLIRLWLALALTVQQRSSSLANVKWEPLENGATPALRSHIAFLRGELDPAAHLDRNRGTSEEATALFVQAFAATRTGSDSARRAARPAFFALADRPDLNIILRAVAAGAVADQRGFTPAPLRLDDPYYASPGNSAWSKVFALLAPGQAIIAEGKVTLPPSVKTTPILRLRRSPRAAQLTLSGGLLTPGPLWEFTGVTLSGNPIELGSGHLLALDQASLNRVQVRGPGTLWARATALDQATLDLPVLALTDVSSYELQLIAGRRADLRRVQADNADITLGAAATAALVDSTLIHRQTSPVRLMPGARLDLTDTWLVAPGGLVSGSAPITARRSRLITDRASPATEIPGLTRTTFNLTGPAQYRPQTPDELETALKAARSGDRIELAPRDYVLVSPVRVPDGVVLRGTSSGANATSLSVNDLLSWSPVISIRSGSAWLENITLKINKRTTKLGDRTVGLGDQNMARQGLAAISSPVTVLRGVGFADWNSYSPETRPAILAQSSRVLVLDGPPARIHVASGAQIDLFAGWSNQTLNLRGDGTITGSFSTNGDVKVDGAQLNFRGATTKPTALAYKNGAGDARIRARRTLAVENYNATVAAAGAELPARLAAAPNVEARMAIFRSLAQRLDPLMRAAQLSGPEVAAAYQRHLNTVLVARRGEFTSLFEALHFYRTTVSHTAWLTHIDTFPPEYRQLLRVHLNALVASRERRDGRLTSEDRSSLIAFMQNYPPGHAEHSRAMDAFRRGTSYADFNATLRAEAAVRARNAEYAAQMAAARARQQREWEAQQSARVAEQTRQPTWWETYSSQYPKGRYSSGSAGSAGSADQQMRNFRRQLNDRIYNTGRDYGQQRVY